MATLIPTGTADGSIPHDSTTMGGSSVGVGGGGGAVAVGGILVGGIVGILVGGIGGL